MKLSLKYITTNVLIKVASLNVASVLTRTIAGFLSSKAIAIYIGAEGLAIIGNLRNFLSTAQSFATLGFYNATVKYVSEFKNDVITFAKTVTTIFYLAIISTILIATICYYSANYISDVIFSNRITNGIHIIKVLAFALPFYTLNILVYAVLNGLSKHKTLITLNILGQVFGLCISLVLIYKYSLQGALISVALVESLICFISLIFVYNRRQVVCPLLKFKTIDYTVAKKMSAYTIMALFSAIALPIVMIAIRSYIINTIGVKEAGFWEAMTRISKYYLLFVSSLITLYLLPRFSEVNSKTKFRKEVFSFYKTILPIFGLGLIVIYSLRSVIVRFIFSEAFIPVEALFLWQLLGDFVKVLSMVIAYQFLAKKMFWHYIITEAFSVVIFYLTSLYFIENYGVKGVTIAHFVTYVLYFVVILILLRDALFGGYSKKH